MLFQSRSDYLKSYRASKSCFGGDLLRGNAKRARPFHSDQALHLVMRSSLAKGKRSLLDLSRRDRIRALIKKQAQRFQIKIYRYSNNGNHLHLLVKPGKRADFIGFLRAISGLIARLVLKAERGQAKGKKFWDKRPFTRIVQWGKAFQRCARYIEMNILEALGFEGLEEYTTPI